MSVDVMFFRKFFSQLIPNDDDGLFREIPLRLAGKLYVSPMPFGAYDPGNDLLKIYQKHKVDRVFVLVTDKELKAKARRNLLKKYDAASIAYNRFVLQDWMAPDLMIVHDMVAVAKKLLLDKRIAVHCHAGVGRTAIAVCCISMAVEGWSAEDAMRHVSQYMTINITDEQRRFIKKYEKSVSVMPPPIDFPVVGC